MNVRITLSLPFLFAGLAAAQAPAPPAAKPDMPGVCLSCHQSAPNTLRGYFDSTAWKTGALQLNLGTATEVVRFDPGVVRVIDAGADKPAEALRSMKRGRDMRVEYTEAAGVKTATLISFKGPIKTPLEKLLKFDDLDKLVALGPEKGGYTLVDSRPAPKYQEGTIPSAVNLPFPAWDKVVGKLPVDKEKLLVFFCQGPTCMMSPNSLAKAEALGYRNAKVYREGWPEWTQKRYGAITPAFVKEAFIAKDIPHVLIDARAAGQAQRTGFIAGAVALPHPEIGSALASFPDKALKAPILVYDAGGGEAVQGAQQIVAAGYENVLVISGGLEAWKATGNALATGNPATKVAYAPKPRAGSIAVAEFRRIATERPANALILDVRTRDEAKFGTIPGALLVPEEEILARLPEIPSDKLIVTHCSTGVRAEMAYHKLREKGYKVAFVSAEVDVGKDGNFEVSVN